MTASAPARLTVDLAAIAANYRRLKQEAGKNCAVAGVVKADAYGLGMEKVTAVLESENCPGYYVATADEALALRRLTAKPVAVLGGLYGAEEEYIRHNITPVINTREDLALWQEAAAARDIQLPAVLHIDTGMNRLGIAYNETGFFCSLLKDYKNIHIAKVMSHFACADDPQSPLTCRQFERFQDVTRHLQGHILSLSNSYGLFADPAFHLNEVRPGMALYGLNPTPGADNPMTPTVALDARVLQVREGAPGETVGYGATYRIEKKTRVAVLSLGYGDGFHRVLGNKAHVYCQGTACPVIGRVSMDLVTVDVSACSPMPQVGDFVEILGPHQSADDLAAIAGTVDYEILTGLGRRYHRNYTS